MRRGTGALVAALLSVAAGCGESVAPDDTNTEPSFSVGPNGLPIYEGGDDGSRTYLTGKSTKVLVTSSLGRRVEATTKCVACWYLDHDIRVKGRYTDTDQQMLSASGGTSTVTFSGEHDDRIQVQLPQSCGTALDANTTHYISRRYWAPFPNGDWGIIDFGENHGFTVASTDLTADCTPDEQQCESDARIGGGSDGPNASVSGSVGCSTDGSGGGGDSGSPGGYYLVICSYVDYYDSDGLYLYSDNLGCVTEYHVA